VIGVILFPSQLVGEKSPASTADQPSQSTSINDFIINALAATKWPFGS